MYKPKYCDICKKEFQPQNGKHKRCVECGRIANRQYQNQYYHSRKIPNRCNVCGVEVKKSKRYCGEHRKERWVSDGWVKTLQGKSAKKEELLRTSDCIIRSQQQQIDELLEQHKELREINKYLEKELELKREVRHEEFDRPNSPTFTPINPNLNRVQKDFDSGDF